MDLKVENALHIRFGGKKFITIKKLNNQSCNVNIGKQYSK